MEAASCLGEGDGSRKEWLVCACVMLCMVCVCTCTVDPIFVTEGKGENNVTLQCI